MATATAPLRSPTSLSAPAGGAPLIAAKVPEDAVGGAPAALRAILPEGAERVKLGFSRSRVNAGLMRKKSGFNPEARGGGELSVVQQ